MRNFALLLFLFANCWQISYTRNRTTFELINSNGNLNGSIDNQIYNETTTQQPENNMTSTTVSSNTTDEIESQNGTSTNRTEKANTLAIFTPDFWNNILGIFSGNVKIGIHGDLSNVASGNLESRGSVGMSVNGQDLTVGAKFGIGGNLGQGVSNTGSIGAGGKVMAKPSFHFQKPKFSLGQLPWFGNGNVKVVNANGGNGNWQNIKEYFKAYVDTPK